MFYFLILFITLVSADCSSFLNKTSCLYSTNNIVKCGWCEQSPSCISVSCSFYTSQLKKQCTGILAMNLGNQKFWNCETARYQSSTSSIFLIILINIIFIFLFIIVYIICVKYSSRNSRDNYQTIADRPLVLGNAMTGPLLVNPYYSSGRASSSSAIQKPPASQKPSDSSTGLAVAAADMGLASAIKADS